ncbi:MAG TPA: sugar transferase [Thermoanaerobaculia bacterium]|nr:sugar transferase [Thermoanaerobaculia bacterium]
MRRLLDVAASVAGLIVLSPLLVAVAIAVKLSSRGPVLHRGERVGRGGALFTLYKFRSMRVGAAGPAITAANDARVTAVGRFLRRTKLDELPQLINVLRGDMSLVGPRPEAPRYVALYDAEQRRILDARPGMTSPASLQYRDEEAQLVGEEWERHYIETIMPAKLRIDLDYLGRRTVVSDLRVIAGTIAALLR